MSKNVQQEKPARAQEVQDWIDRETALQGQRYQVIVQDMNDLQPQRAEWIAEFLNIIQTRGYNVNTDARRVVTAGEMPEKPDHPDANRVVW